ncbi:unnamed protein product [Coregonus sp. 'balchen']|nr:unnamed protein product [Coregonus sp. 'balchen']
MSQILNKKREYRVYNNLPKEQRQALEDLKNDSNADKGGAVVLLNRDDYVNEIWGQLNNTTFYQKLSRDPTPPFKDEIHCKLNRVSLPAYVRDSMGMINTLKTMHNINGEMLMSCFDVESLYTTIPHQGGLEAMAHYLSQRPTGTLPSTNCIVELAEIVVTKNFFMFDNYMFIQQNGTAMGSKMAPNYANLYLGLFEKNVIFSPNNPFLRHIRLWKHLIDDAFLLFQGTAEEFHRFHSFINTSSEHLKFTLIFDAHETSFLYIWLRGMGVFLARIYTGSQRTGIPCYAETASTLHP